MKTSDGGQKLARSLIDLGVLEDEKVIKAFEAVDRRDFLPDSQKPFYLDNKPLPIGYKQTNSQPFTVAFMLELLLPQPGEKILDLGSGSGWTAALIGSMVEDGQIYAVEKISELVDQAKSNLSKYKDLNIEVVPASNELGLPEKAPFDKILVSAAAQEVPKVLIEQLKDKGRLIIPVNKSILVVEKTKDGLKTHEFEGFRFVPLV